MSFIKNYVKILHIAFLSTTCIFNCFSTEQPHCEPKDTLISIKKNRSNEDNIKWIEQSFSNLKQKTDILRTFKYTNKFTTSEPTEIINSIESWNQETKSFHPDIPFFQLSVKDFRKNFSLSNLDPALLPHIMYTLLIKGMKKEKLLDIYSCLKESDFILRRDIPENREILICALFDTIYNYKKDKTDFTDQITKICFGKKPSSLIANKIKLLYSPTETQKKHTEIKSRVEGSWNKYLIGIKCINKFTDDQKDQKQIFMKNISSVTLPAAMEGIADQDIADYFAYLFNKNIALRKFSGFKDTEKTTNNRTLEVIPSTTNTQVLAIGKSLIDNLNGYTLKEKKSWIIDACSLLKVLEDEINQILIGTFFDNCLYTYPNWNDQSRSFDANDDFKIARLFKTFGLVFDTLNNITEKHIDELIPPLLAQIFKINWEYSFWTDLEKLPSNSEKKEDKEDKEELMDFDDLSWGIFQNTQDSITLTEESENLICKYILKHFGHHIDSQNPNFIYLYKITSSSFAPIEKLINISVQNIKQFAAKLEKIRALAENNTPKIDDTVYKNLFIENFLPGLEGYSDQDLRKAINILGHKNEMFRRFNKSIDLALIEKSKSTKIRGKTKLQDRMREKLRQPKTNKEEKSIVKSDSDKDNERAFLAAEALLAEIQNEKFAKSAHKKKERNAKNSSNIKDTRLDEIEKASHKKSETSELKSRENSTGLVPFNGKNAILTEGNPFMPSNTTRAIQIKNNNNNTQKPAAYTSNVKKQPFVDKRSYPQNTPQRQRYNSRPIQTPQNIPDVKSTIAPTKITQKKIVGTTGLSWSDVVRNPFFFHSEEQTQITPQTLTTPITSPQISTKTTVSKIPTVIQQLNYMLINNPNYQNENSYSADTKIIIPNKEAEKIVIQTGTINIEGKINITLHEKKMQPSTIIKPIVVKEQPVLSIKKRPKLIVFLETEDFYPNPTAKSLPIISTQTTSTTSANETPTLIQQVNYILANNPSQNGNLVTQDNKVIIATEGVEKISIQTGTINNEGENNISVYVYHH